MSDAVGSRLLASMELRDVAPAEVELIRTLTMILKMPSRPKVIRQLRERYEAENAGDDDAFAYGVCAHLDVAYDPNDSDKALHCFAASQAFTRCLASEPGWWLPRFLRAELNEILPTELVTASSSIRSVAYERIDPRADLLELVDRQRRVPAVAHHGSIWAALLRHGLHQGQVDSALEEFTRGTALFPVAASGHRLDLLAVPFHDCVALLRKADRPEAAELVLRTARTIYPHTSILRHV